jgi:hypothetical protein
MIRTIWLEGPLNQAKTPSCKNWADIFPFILKDLYTKAYLFHTFSKLGTVEARSNQLEHNIFIAPTKLQKQTFFLERHIAKWAMDYFEVAFSQDLFSLTLLVNLNKIG